MARIHPNREGRERIMRSRRMAKAVADVAERIADSARQRSPEVGELQGSGEMEMPVEVSLYETDRARATVWLAHPAGLAVQAKHGVLTKAASDEGLEVHAVLYYTTKSGVTRRASQRQIDNWTRGSR